MLAMFEAVIVAFAAFYVWVFVSQLHTPGFRRIQKWLRRGWRLQLTGCPYCLGWWLSLIFTIAIQWGHLDWVITPLTALAAAGICGYIGSLTPGIDLEDGEE